MDEKRKVTVLALKGAILSLPLFIENVDETEPIIAGLTERYPDEIVEACELANREMEEVLHRPFIRRNGNS